MKLNDMHSLHFKTELLWKVLKLLLAYLPYHYLKEKYVLSKIWFSFRSVENSHILLVNHIICQQDSLFYDGCVLNPVIVWLANIYSVNKVLTSKMYISSKNINKRKILEVWNCSCASVCKCTCRHMFLHADVYIYAYKLVNHSTIFIYILCSVFLVAKTVWERAQNITKNCFAVSSP